MAPSFFPGGSSSCLDPLRVPTEPETGSRRLRSVFENRIACGPASRLWLARTMTGPSHEWRPWSTGLRGRTFPDNGARCAFGASRFGQVQTGEFDPGSGRTLAACLRHASRARKPPSGGEYSGARVSNAWVIYLRARDNLGKLGLIPDETTRPSDLAVKDGLSMEAITRR